MREKYITPEIEIIEFEEAACVTMSGGGNISSDIGDNDVNMEDAGWE